VFFNSLLMCCCRRKPEKAPAAPRGGERTLLILADSETEGVDAKTNRMLQWSSVFATIYSDGTVEELEPPFDSHIHFTGELKKVVKELLKVDMAVLHQAPPFDRVYEDWKKAVREHQAQVGASKTILAGYNFGFDLRFLKAELARLGLELEAELASLGITTLDVMGHVGGIVAFDYPLFETEIANVSLTQSSVFFALHGYSQLFLSFLFKL